MDFQHGNQPLCNHYPQECNQKDQSKTWLPPREYIILSILSHFLWNLLIHDLLNFSVNLIPGHIQAFADDLMTLAEGDDTDIYIK